jgi:MFS family permease
MLMIALFLYLLGNLLRVNSSQVLLGDLVPRALRGKAVGFLQFFLYLAQAFVFLLGGFLYEFVNPQLPFLLLATAAAPLALLVMLKVSEPKIKEV